MKTTTVILLICSLLVSIVALSGCVAIAAAGSAVAGTVAYIRGDFQAIMDKPMDDIYKASKLALTDLEMKIVGTDKDALSAVIRAEGAEGRTVTIKLKRMAKEPLIKLTIRVGVFGDKTVSQIIYSKIQKKLSLLP